MLAIVLIVLGALGTAYSFLSAPKTKEQAKAILEAHASHGHGDSHEKAPHHEEHKDEKQHVETKEAHASEVTHKEDTHGEEKHGDDHSSETVVEHAAHNLGEHATEKVSEHAKHTEEVLVKDHTSDHDSETVIDHVKHSFGDHAEETVAEHKVHTNSHVSTAKESHTNTHEADAHHNEDHHVEHALHQMQNRPWSAFYVSMLFFLGITLLVMAFYASQRVAHAGWSVALFRVFEAITNNMHFVSVFAFIFIIATFMHLNHLFPWMADGVFDPQSPNYDSVVDGKKWFKNIYNINVGFIVFFLISESMMSWDWIMGIDPHWFSTLFGWYVLATFLVSALTVIAFVTIYLRSKGALPLVNDSHIHDLAKFMFGFSVFWTYLWFAQFMLIWYADIPEETTYYAQRFNEYKLPFLSMVVMNFLFPVLLLINSDFKSIPWFVVLGGIVIILGHYVDLFIMIMPGTVGAQWGFGIGEISGFLFFLGIFIYATFSAFAKANPVVKGNPFLHESETHHYYNIEHRGEDNHGHH